MRKRWSPFGNPASLTRGFVTTTGLSVSGKLAAFVINPLLAVYFGAGRLTDVYYCCLSASVLGASFVTSINTSVVIPHAMHLKAGNGRVAAQQFLNCFLAVYLIVAAAVATCFLHAPTTVLSAIAQFSRSDLIGAEGLIRAFAVAFFFSTITNALADFLFAERLFVVPGLVSIGPPVLGFVSLLLFHERLGVTAVPLGWAAAYAMQSVSLVVLMWQRLQWTWIPAADFLTHGVARAVLLGYLGNMISTLNSYLPYFLLSGFSAGTITAFNYAQSIAGIPTTILTTQVSSVLGVRFNELAAQGRDATMARLFQRAAEALHLVLLSAMWLMVLFSGALLHLFYGRSGVARSVLGTAALILQLLACMVPLQVVNTLTARVFMARRMVGTSVAYQSAFGVALLALSLAAVWVLGPAGYPCALVCAYSTNLVCVRALLRRALPQLDYGAVLRKFAVAALLSGAIAAVVRMGVGVSSVQSDGARLALGSTVYAMVFFFVVVRYALNDDLRQVFRGWSGARP